MRLLRKPKSHFILYESPTGMAEQELHFLVAK